MKHLLPLLAIVGASMLMSLSPATAAEAATPLALGPLTPSPALAVYIVGDGKPLMATVTIKHAPKATGDRLMIRAFDPDENLAFWKYIEPGGQSDLNTKGDGEISVPSKTLNPADAVNTWFTTDLKLDKPGIHQIRVTSGTQQSAVTVTLSRTVGYGVSFQNDYYKPWQSNGTAPGTLYAFIPPHAEEMNISGGPVVVSDGATDVIRHDSGDQNASNKADITKTGEVWTFTFPRPADWKLRAWGFPIILCPTPEAARAIHASVETLADGTVVTWKFQKRIAEMLPKLLDPKNVGTAESLIVPLTTRKDEWMKNPLRNRELLSPYSAFTAVEEALRNQNVDPTSHWSGAMGSASDGKLGGWKVMAQLPAPQNRWDRLKSIPGLQSGASARSLDAEGLALAATLNSPINPYYGKRELLYRAAASALRDLMTLGEDEVWRGESVDADSYPGMLGFALGQKTMPTYGMAAPLMPAEVRGLWTEGMRHIIDRTFPDGLVSCRNQSSHYLVIYDDYAKGSGDPAYLKLALSYGKRFIDGNSPGGYALESMGPDLTYNGMSHWHMGVYYRETGDKAMAAAIAKSYRFFNYTVAPEPDGTMLGASNFGHRTGGSFVGEQWGGARGIASDIPEVGVWVPKELTGDAKAKAEAEARSQIASALQRPSLPDGCTVSTPHFLYYDVPIDRTGVFPANEAHPFIREIGGELVAVKRPGYYAVVYVGKPAPHPHYISGKENFRHPMADNAENTGGSPNFRKVTPFTGGGLSLLQTPAYGNVLITANWSAVTHNGLVAVKQDDNRYWEDYFATKYQLDEPASKLTVSGRIESLPIAYVREYRFADAEVTIKLTLTAEKDVQLTRLFENIPLALGAVKANGAVLAVDGKAVDSATTTLVTVRDHAGAGADIRFDGDSRTMTIQRNGPKGGTLQIGRVEVDLPSALKAGQMVEMTYHIVPK
ncbi:MAG TPA: hypothetical protein VGK19_16725 [Capsulimonadaceae bacterium]|jgi:hypothetical protein